MAQRLEVNIRTLRRYITMLQDLGIPIVAERGRTGSYELAAEYTLPPMMFTNNEALALSVGLLTARDLGLTEITQAIESAQAKLEQVMPPHLRDQVRSLTETVTFDPGALPINSSGRVLLTMSRAVQLQCRVRLRYCSRANEETERNFDPYGITFREGCWYAVGFCSLRNDLRSFRLDRIIQIELTDNSFKRPSDFDALNYVIQSVATLPRRFTFEVLLKTDIIRAHREIFDVLGVLEPHPEGVLMRGSVEDLDWLAHRLAGFSFDFTVIAPDELNDAIRKCAESLLRLVNRN